MPQPPAPSGLPVPLYRARALARRGWWRMADRLRAPAPPSLPARAPTAAPLRVGFVVCSQEKWGLGSVLAHLQAEPGFEVGFYHSLSDVHLRLPAPARRRAFERERAFFAGLGPIWADLYAPDSDRMIGPDGVRADVVFLQQPWGMQDWPRILARRTRVAYVHYGMAVISNDRMQFGLRHFHPWLWRYFLPTQAHAQAIETAPGPRPPALCVTGHPKFDAYQSAPPARHSVTAWPRPHEPARPRVIFAPHHGLEPGSLGLGTFGWSGAALLDLARAHPEVDFVLRPHPNMALGLSRAGLMSAQDWAGYKTRWAGLPNGAVFEGGAYMEVLRSSDMMITDSGSFLAEYLPTGAPLVRLERDGAAPLNDFGARLAGGFYTARDATELGARFDALLRGEDPLAPARAEATALLRPLAQSAAQRIAEELRRP